LHAGDQDLIAGLQKGARKTVRHQIDALGSALGENHLLARRRIDEALHGVAHVFQTLCRALAQRMYAAMHIGVVLFVVVTDRVDHRLRLLRGGAVVEINQRTTVHGLMQRRELRAQRFDIEGRYGGCVHRQTSALGKAAISCSAKKSFSVGLPVSSSPALRKPSVSSAMASSRSMPRVRR